MIRLDALLSREQLEQNLRKTGEDHYHNKHPFHKLLHSGQLNKGQVQAWALNRYCYQAAIPIKDATLMARLPDQDLRREWRQRIVDHDGEEEGKGGIERWLKLTGDLGLDRDYVASRKGALPATKFAVDAYIHFVSDMPLLDAVASSLTEIFSPKIIAERMAGMLKNYDFVTEETMAYFKPRLTQARRDVEWALNYALDNARTVEQQQNVLDALHFKCSVLWSQLDALYFAYVEPGFIPPGCFDPAAAGKQRNMVSAGSSPSLPAHVQLHHDTARDRWVLLAPERLLEPDEVALNVLNLCDGKKTVQQISDELARDYNAPVEQIQNDILPMLQDLADKDFLQT